MEKKELTIIFVVIMMALGLSGLIYFGLQNKPCTTTITFSDGTKINCKSYHSSDNGMTRYTTCNHETVTVPSNSIKSIKKQ